MKDIKNPRLMYLKCMLFLVTGTLSSALLVREALNLRTVLLLLLAIWSFCRAYYFMFYVLERYVDPGYRFSGLGSLIRYLWSRRG